MSVSSAVKLENVALPRITQWVSEGFSVSSPGALYIHNSGKYRFSCTQTEESKFNPVLHHAPPQL